MTNYIRNKAIVILFSAACCLTSFTSTNAQNNSNKIDSLKQKLAIKNADTTRINAYLALVGAYENSDISIGSKYMDSAYIALKKTNYKKGLSLYLIRRIKFKIFNTNYKQAIGLSKQAQAFFLKEKDTKNYLLACQFEAYSLGRDGQIDQATHLLNAVISKYKNTSYQNQIGQFYFELGQQYLHQGLSQKGLINLQTALLYYKKTRDQEASIHCYRMIQYIYLENGNYKKALSFGSYIMQYKNQDQRSLSNDILIMGKIYYKMGEYKKAESLLMRSYKLAQKLNVDQSLFILSELTNNYIELKNYDAIIHLNTNALSNSELNSYDTYTIYSSLIKAYILKEQFVKAKEYTDRALLLIKKDENLFKNDILIDFYGNVSITENKLGNYKVAYHFLTLSDSLYRCSINKKNILKNIEQLAVFDSKMKESKIRKDNLIKQKQQLTIKNNINYIYTLIAFLFVIMISIIILIIFYLKVNKIKKALFNKNIIISDQKMITDKLNVTINQALHERELLLKEIHHRVKNNLQIIMSLLSIQAKEGGDINDINYFLEKSQSRILAISLIHQNLYENENLENIDYKLYLNDLCKNLDSVLNVWNKNILFKINVDAVVFDLQTAIPLGLIINELVSNSYKHAFSKGIEGEIEITIVSKFEKEYKLIYRDNGIGFIDNENLTPKSLGMELVRLLTSQLKGKLTKMNVKKGTAYQIDFEKII